MAVGVAGASSGLRSLSTAIAAVLRHWSDQSGRMGMSEPSPVRRLATRLITFAALGLLYWLWGGGVWLSRSPAAGSPLTTVFPLALNGSVSVVAAVVSGRYFLKLSPSRGVGRELCSGLLVLLSSMLLWCLLDPLVGDDVVFGAEDSPILMRSLMWVLGELAPFSLTLTACTIVGIAGLVICAQFRPAAVIVSALAMRLVTHALGGASESLIRCFGVSVAHDLYYRIIVATYVMTLSAQLGVSVVRKDE